ncbi:S-methyl-5-thioribose-1-phosphate isomerase [candidate division TA06 bacterium]|uniref:Methylthioribose-1-phosphate isomerase n=1 Tax=candidate division TA06 bacterium TaxID=2250710 RepID=A0A933IEZ8_UNCT6|nr:S-methyl-5-thioribose-1-phosphate isomerase [candidate division TA06 bacterium]
MKPIEWKNGSIALIDQRELPGRLKYLNCDNVEKLAWAIETLAVRGAPLIGIAGAYGLALGIRNSTGKSLQRDFTAAFQRIKKTRPTAVNLFWALERMEQKFKALAQKGAALADIKASLLAEAKKIQAEDAAACAMIGRYGSALIEPGSSILTHCNSGALATGGIGTALGVIFTAFKRGRIKMVYADETRPLLQGARLTAWELMQEKIPATLICDNMAAFLMAQKKIDCVIVGADRIARNGDFANKIGTYSLAVLAQHHRIPFYVAVPLSTFDSKIKNGQQIPIEQREPEEIRSFGSITTAPPDIAVYNPSFDVTPSHFVTAFITEQGIVKPSFEKNIPVIKNKE